jgi:hypothetical protein
MLNLIRLAGWLSTAGLDLTEAQSYVFKPFRFGSSLRFSLRMSSMDS